MTEAAVKFPGPYQTILQYLGIDYADEVVLANVTRAWATAMATVRGAVGDDVDTMMGHDPRVEELMLIYLEDLYSNRGVSAKVSGATRQLVRTMELQLQMELRRRRAAAEEASV